MCVDDYTKNVEDFQQVTLYGNVHVYEDVQIVRGPNIGRRQYTRVIECLRYTKSTKILIEGGLHRRSHNILLTLKFLARSI